MQFKMIYLARRNPALTEDEWPAAWRQHAKFASQFPSIGAAISSLHYCSRIYNPRIEGKHVDLPQASRRYDGVAIIAAASRHELSGHLSEEDRARIHQDERRAFETLTPNFTFFAQESLVYGGSPGAAAVIRFLARRPEISPEEFAARWGGHANVMTRAAGVADGVTRYVHDSLVEPPPPGYEFDGISETWFATPEDAIRSFEDDAFAAAERELAGFSDAGRNVTMLTEVINRWPRT